MNRPRDTELGPSQGVIKFYSQQHGYGFITLRDGRDCFFHFTGLQKDQDPAELKPDTEVTCILWKQNGEHVKGNGLKATAVRVV